jgi:hypothetical protein
MMRKITVAGIAIVAVAGLAAIVIHAKRRSDPACDTSEITKRSPSGTFRATLTNEKCGWGFGLAANTVTAKIERSGPGGWFLVLPLEYDGFSQDLGAGPPTIEWQGPNSLAILVHTRAISGTLVRRDDELTIIRTYVSTASR